MGVYFDISLLNPDRDIDEMSFHDLGHTVAWQGFDADFVNDYCPELFRCFEDLSYQPPCA